MSRNKREACKYDTAAPTLRAQQKRGNSSNGDADSPTAPRENPSDSIPTKVANFGYSATGVSTLGFLRKIDGANPAEPLSRLANDAGGTHADHLNMRERYKSLIRQLPARTYIDQLVEIYFHDFNWMYYGLDRDVFDRQLAEWFSLPFNLLTNGGPQALSPDLRSFPALLFQVLATALLVLPSGPDPTFDSLKYAGNMTFEDLAMDYSESGVAILSLLGKRQMSITTVLAGFARASFLKYVALVTESVSYPPSFSYVVGEADQGSGMRSAARSGMRKRSACTGIASTPSRRATTPRPYSKTSGRSSGGARSGCYCSAGTCTPESCSGGR